MCLAGPRDFGRIEEGSSRTCSESISVVSVSVVSVSGVLECHLEILRGASKPPLSAGTEKIVSLLFFF